MSRSRYHYDLPEHPVEYGVKVNVADIQRDDRSQRTLNEHRARQIAENIVPEAVGSIILSKRDDADVYYVVDGQHRWRAYEILNATQPSRYRFISAEIHHGLTQQQEAALFLIKNRESTKPKPQDEYDIGLLAGLPLFVDTDKVVRAHGLAVGNSSVNSIGAIQGLLRITDEHGPEMLDRVLTIADAGWGNPRTSKTWDGVLLGGLCKFLAQHGDKIDDKRLVEKIAAEGVADRWVARVHGNASEFGMRGSGTLGRVSACYKLLVAAWNHKLSSSSDKRLP